jgi:hypothetical protein
MEGDQLKTFKSYCSNNKNVLTKMNINYNIIIIVLLLYFFYL